VLLTLDAQFVAFGSEGKRIISAASMFEGLFETALRPTEVLTEIQVPALAPNTKWRYVKFRRRSQDWATVGVCVVATVDSAGGFSRAAVGLANMGLTPLRAGATELALAKGGIGAVTEASGLAAEATSPPSDTGASSEFRRHLAGVLVRRALEDALGAEERDETQTRRS
jgi:aerobic carbon-monoxide dehydrogenase medium subunit